MKKISDVCWEIDTSFKQDMRVPARIYATKKLLDNMDAGVFEQILSEELPLTTARRAYRTAVKIASGELDVYREFPPDSMGRKKFVKKVTK